MSGLWDALSAAATPLATAAGANQQGIQAGNQINTQNLLDAVQLYRQQAQDQLSKQETQARIGLQGAQKSEADARASTLLNPIARPRESYTVPGVGLGHYDENNKFVVDQAEPPKPIAGVKLGPGENEYNADGSVKIKGPAATQNFTPLVTTGASGEQQVTPFSTHQGTVLPPVATAKQGTGAGGGAIANRQKDYVGLIGQGLPTMEALAAKVNPYNITALSKYPNAANPMVTSDERNYMQAFRTFLAGVLHEESGARLSDKQVEWGLLRYGPTMGDDAANVQQKLASAKQTYATRKQNAGVNDLPSDAPVSESAKQSFNGVAGAGGRSVHPIFDKYGLTPPPE